MQVCVIWGWAGRGNGAVWGLMISASRKRRSLDFDGIDVYYSLILGLSLKPTDATGRDANHAQGPRGQARAGLIMAIIAGQKPHTSS